MHCHSRFCGIGTVSSRRQVPQKEDSTDVVTLKARDKAAIVSAKAQIELLLEEQEERLPYTPPSHPGRKH